MKKLTKYIKNLSSETIAAKIFGNSNLAFVIDSFSAKERENFLMYHKKELSV